MELKKPNHIHIKFSIEKWEREESLTSNTSTIIYQVEVESCLKENKWSLSRPLESLQSLITNLSTIHLNMPQPPRMSDTKGLPSAITLIGKSFELYLKSLLIRGDIINSDLIADFFELKRHYYPDISKCQLRRLSDKQTKYQISDFYYDEVNDIVFIGCGKKLSIGFIENTIPYYVLKIFNRENLGQILVYKLNTGKSNGKAWSNSRNAFDQCLFQLDTKSEVSKLKYYHQSQCNNYLIAAYYNGTIDVFECPSNYSAYISSQFLKLIDTIELSNGKLLSFGFNIISHYIYYISRKGKEICISCIDSKKNTEKPITISSRAIIGFEYDDKLNCFITLCDDYTVMASIIENDVNVKTLYSFKSYFNESVSLFKVDYKARFIMIGGYYGKLCLYSFDDNFTAINKAFSINLKSNRLEGQAYVELASLYEISEVVINSNKNELIIGTANGVIQLFSHAIDTAEYAYKSNNGAISKIHLCDSNNDNSPGPSYALVSSYDQSISLISIPMQYLNEKIVNKKNYKAVNIFNYPSSQLCNNEVSIPALKNKHKSNYIISNSK